MKQNGARLAEFGVTSSSYAGGVLGNRLAVAFEMGVRNSIVILVS